MGCGKSGSEEKGDSKLGGSVSIARRCLTIFMAFLPL